MLLFAFTLTWPGVRIISKHLADIKAHHPDRHMDLHIWCWLTPAQWGVPIHFSRITKMGVQIISIKLERCSWKLVSLAWALQTRGADKSPSDVGKITWAVPATWTHSLQLTKQTEILAGKWDHPRHVCATSIELNMGSQVYWFVSSHLGICIFVFTSVAMWKLRTNFCVGFFCPQQDRERKYKEKLMGWDKNREIVHQLPITNYRQNRFDWERLT